MFSKLLSSARHIFTKPEEAESHTTLHQVLDSTGRRSPAKRSPKKSSPRKQQIPVKSAYTVQKEKRDNAIMVTTRRQSGALLLGSQSGSAATSENEINEDEIAYELLTQSAQKRRREKAREAGEETPSKRRKLPVRGKTESPAVTVHSRLAVEIPVKDVDSEGEATPKAISDVAAKLVSAESPAATPTQPKKRGRPAKNVVLADANEQLQKDVARFEAEKAQKAAEKSVVETPQATKSTKSTRKGKKSPPAQAAEKVEKVATPPVDSPKKETPAKPKHKKFGDDEPVAPIPLPEPLAEALEEESGSEDESSDDDAPEEVGGKAAQEKAQASRDAAAKVAEQKEAAERQKRKEKDEKLKAQAQAAKKRKLVEEEKAKKEAEQEAESESEEDESMTLQEEFSPKFEVTKEVTRETKKIKFDRNNLPDLLPEDFLEDEDMMDVDSEAEERPGKAKKIKFAQEEKKIRDVTLGHTTFRVQKKSKAGLAPKANKRAKMLKEALLGKRKGQIRKTPTGFFGAKK